MKKLLMKFGKLENCIKLSIIDKFYSGKKSKLYEKERNNSKWKFEQKQVENFLKGEQEIVTVLDAPVGTNRYGNLIDKLDNIKVFYGLDLSQDMLDQAEVKNTKKLYLEKFNIINDSIKLKFDLLIMIRFLNLINENNFIKVLNNVLPNINKRFVISLRHSDKSFLIENKIYIHNLSLFKFIVKKFNFKIRSTDFNDNKDGQYSIFFGEK